MKKNDLFIDMYLQEQQCTMINPGYKHLKDEDGFITFTKQERNPDNLTKLENTVSQRMQLGYKHALIETLEKKTPIVYIDCSER
ncbi:TPA: hypothetical protein DCZ39_06175 [Patescibacteria group bacterium]|nr:hypothetical protein [Candidatus Gracilibacteria bacterium]